MRQPGSGACRAPAAVAAEGVLVQGRSQWVPVAWDALPGWGNDNLFEAWNAWLKSCEKPPAPWAALCPEVRRLSIGSAARAAGLDAVAPAALPRRVVQGESNGLADQLFRAGD